MLAGREGTVWTKPSPGCGNHARNHNLRLVDVARDVITGELLTAKLDPSPPAPRFRAAR